MMLVETLVLISVVAYLLYRFSIRNHDYWKKRNVPTPKLLPFFGTDMDILCQRVAIPLKMKSVYDQFPDEPLVGLLQANRPAIMVKDPGLIKYVCTKDFSFFHDRGVARDEKVNPLEGHLFALEGARWRNLRMKLTPTFSTGKMKKMFPLMLECTKELFNVLEGPAANEEEVDLKDITGRLTTDIIGSCAFGVNCNSLKDPNAEFRRYGSSIFENSFKNRIRLALLTISPKLGEKIQFRGELNKFFLRTVRETIQFREENNVKRNDFMDCLIEIRKKGKIVDDLEDFKNDPFITNAGSISNQDIEFTDNLMAAQAFVFFVAGFETSSTTLSFALLELASHPEIQETLQEEVDRVLKNHGGMTYEAIMEMYYMDKVIAETLRKYPPLYLLVRKATEKYQFPGTKTIIDQGTRVYLPVYAIHHDPQYYPDPDRFDPERFSPEFKSQRPGFTYMPFGEGPRICIGQRFGLLQTKVGLASIMSRYSVHPSKRTVLPIVFKKLAPVITSEGGCFLSIKRR